MTTANPRIQISSIFPLHDDPTFSIAGKFADILGFKQVNDNTLVYFSGVGRGGASKTNSRGNGSTFTRAVLSYVEDTYNQGQQAYQIISNSNFKSRITLKEIRDNPDLYDVIFFSMQGESE